MNNIAMKMALAILTLSILTACGPSQQEINQAKAVAINNAYQDMLWKSSKLLDPSLSKEKHAELDLEAKTAVAKWKKLMKEAKSK